MANCNYKVKMKDIQNKYKFKIFCAGYEYDDTELRNAIDQRALISEAGRYVELELNPNTYVLTAKLKDKNNNLISTSTPIDLPLESMIVDCDYDATTKSLIITLQNGNTTSIPLGDLISGLATEEDLNEVRDNLEVVQNELNQYKTIYNVLPKVENEGEALTLNDTGNATLKINLKGNTSQVSYTGKNLFDVSRLELGTIDQTTGEDSSSTTQYRTTYYISCNEGDNFVQSNEQGYNLRAFWYAEDYSYVGTTAFPPNSYITAPNNAKNMKITTAGNFSATAKYQIEKGTTATSYEEYVGGIPTPTPDNPSNVNVVKGNNTIKITNKNLFNYGTTSDYTGVGLTYFEVRSNNLYNLIASGSANNMFKNDKYYGTKFYLTAKYDKGTPRLLIKAYDSNDTQITSSVSGWTYNSYYQAYFKDSTTGEFDLSSASYIKFGVAWVGTAQEYGTYTDIMITNTDDKEYETYKEQVYQLNLGNIELCKKGDYQDYIYKNNDKWYLYKAIGKIILDGDENFGGYAFGNYYRYNVSVNDLEITPKTSQTMLANYFGYTATALDSVNCKPGMFCQYTGASTNIYFVSAETTSNNFKNWLSTHNVEVYYVLETPTNTEITDTTLISQLDTLESAMSYKAQTNISQINNDAPFIINASALYDLNNLITRVAILETE